MEEKLPAPNIELEPFVHQVGGHSFMLSLDEATVCKPLVDRELQFYQTLPDGVGRFTPRFYGIIHVNTVEKDEYVTFIATPPDQYQVQQKRKTHCIRLRKTGSIEITDREKVFQDDQAEDTEGESSAGLNPWVIKCHRDNMNKLIESFETHSSSFREFIVLENLTKKFTYPCILDLKMGTRQYGDAASLAKKQSKMFKVVSTTSAKLGLRVGGMQVYQVPSRHYLCRNKYYGRKLSIGGFQQALVQFLHNGTRFRTDVLSVLIRRLEELLSVLCQQEAMRFYTTSLLLLYEGEDQGYCENPESPKTQDEDSKETFVEFINKNMERQDSFKKLKLPVSDLLRKTSSAESLYLDDVTVEDIGKMARQHRRSSSTVDNINSPEDTSSNASSSSTIFEDCRETFRRSSKTIGESFRCRSLSTKSDSGSLISEPKVDVKMIDFAHSTHKALDDPVTYSGPDKGFLFGLEKLIAMLKAIEDDFG